MRKLSDCRVLIVDDAPSNVRLLTDTLKGEYRVSSALDGETALEAVRTGTPDLVLLDLSLPGMDGLEVLERLRADAATRELPVMILSALEDVEVKARGFELGANDYLTKPFEIVEVRARVRSLLKAKAYSDAVRAALDRDLSIARQIQLGILQSDLTACADGTGLDVHALLEPAQKVGGDLYLAMRTAPGRVFVAVGDVSGKGIPAALFMAVTTTLLRSLAREHPLPETVLARLNEELEATNRGQLFVTLVCSVFDVATGRVRVANAGHPSPVLLASSGGARAPFPATGTVAGLFSDAAYGSREEELGPGDALVYYTDGVSEASGPDGEPYGEEGIVAALLGRPRGTAREIAEGLLDGAKRHSGNGAAEDDVTVLAIRRGAP